MLLGHFTGDFLLQSQWMALNKKDSVWACYIHCTIYTFCILLALHLWGLHIKWYIPYCIFVSHWILDGTRLLERWFEFYGIRTWDTALPRKDGGIDFDALITVRAAIQTSFGAIVHTVADNTVHIILMVLIFKFLGGL